MMTGSALRLAWLASLALILLLSAGCSHGHRSRPVGGTTTDGGDGGQIPDSGQTTDAADAGQTTDAADAGQTTDAADAGETTDGATDAGQTTDGATDAGQTTDGATDAGATDSGGCPTGYTGTAGNCTDINECTTGTPCGDKGTGCTNTPGSYTCTCATGFKAPASGGTCQLTDPSLVSLVPSAGTLSFDSAITLYQLKLPAGATSVTLTPTVTYPTHATITVDGATVASGTASLPITEFLHAASVVVTTDSGAVRTYTVVIWRSTTYVKASNTDANDNFGSSVAISSDGSTLAVGAYNESSNATGIGGNQADNSASYSGAVYVFTRSGMTWSQQAYIKASNTGAGDYFGYKVALSSDGSTLAVGAPHETSNATGVGGDPTDNSLAYAGAVYVFTRSNTTWSQQAYVKASNTDAGDSFGSSVTLSGDGSTLAVGAYGEASNATGIGGNQADNSDANAGAVYVFTRSGTTWSQQAYIKASNTDAGDSFGYAVALSADGSTLAVGANEEASNATGIGGNQNDNSAGAAGAVYVFTRSGTTWTQQAYIKASNTDASDRFGFSVGLSSDGSTLAVGAIGESSNGTDIGSGLIDNSASMAGAVYVFTRSGTTWSQEAYVKASNTDAGDLFGNAVALSADSATLAVGAYEESSKATGIGGNQADNSASRAGAVYVY